MARLQIESLSAFYGNLCALDHVSFEVLSGEMVAIIGANGAGKTTCLRSLSGLTTTTGRIRFDGDDISRLSPQAIVRLGVIHCPEGRHLFPEMTVVENLLMGAFLRRDRGEIRMNFEKIYDIFPVLYARRNQCAGKLSGGEQQMLAIGRALMSRPRILLLDEPSFGVAPVIVDRIFDALRRLNSAGLTTLLVEQNVGLALDVCNRAYVLEGGRIVMSGTAHEISTNQSVREAYLGV